MDEIISKAISIRDNLSIPESDTDKIYNSIVRIEYEVVHPNTGIKKATGFFMKFNAFHFLITNNHEISEEEVKNKIKIKIYF